VEEKSYAVKVPVDPGNRNYFFAAFFAGFFLAITQDTFSWSS